MSDENRGESAHRLGLVGLAGLGSGLVVLASILHVTHGIRVQLAILVVATGLLLVAEAGWVLARDAPVHYGRSFLTTTASAALLAAVGVAAAVAETGAVSLVEDGGRIAFLAGVGANVGFAAEVQSGRLRSAARRAERAETTAERLSEERGRFAVLNETTRALLRCADADSVARTLVKDGRIGLPGPFAGVWLYDDDRDRLVPVSVKRTDPSWEADQLWPDGEAMAAFRAGEPGLVSDPQLPEVGELYAVPMGEHGLLVVGAGTVDSRSRDLAEVYGLTGQAALDRLERERKLERQNERLEAFASAVAHDLRNPLNVVDGRVALARDTEDLSHLDAVERSVDRMETIVEDVLELARGGETVVEAESLQLGSAVDDAWDNVRTPEATLEVGFLPTVEADADRLGRLFENLFRNAVEHGSTSNRNAKRSDDAVEHGSTSPPSQARGDAVEHGSTSPRSQAHEDAVERESDGVVVSVGSMDGGFYVADDGPGIPPNEREKVLTEGYSGGGGTGLGLAIVRQIAEAHGWSVSVTQSETGGARFEFRT